MQVKAVNIDPDDWRKHKFDAFEGPHSFGRSVYLRDGRRRIGEIHIQQVPHEPENARVLWAEIGRKYQGQGFGKYLYVAGIRDAFQMNPEINAVTCDTFNSVSDAALHVWQSLARRYHCVSYDDSGLPQVTRQAFAAVEQIV